MAITVQTYRAAVKTLINEWRQLEQQAIDQRQGGRAEVFRLCADRLVVLLLELEA